MHELILKLYQLALSSHILSTLLEPVHIVILLLPVATLALAIIILTGQLRLRTTLTTRNLISTYSFIWYIAVAYLLIILPLPTRSSVAALTTASYNLHPFYFLEQLKLLTPFQLHDTSTWVSAFTSSTFFQPFFNILLFMPIGAYLKWRHHWSLGPITLISFTLSLFFETTQLTGLYGYYSRAYRMFDVDDLLMNTLGGIVGAVGLVFIPQRWRNQDHSPVLNWQNHPINWRRIGALLVDWLLIAGFDGVYFVLVKHYGWQLPHDFRWLYIANILVFFILPALLTGKTIGGRLFNSRIQSQAGHRANFFQILIHYGGLYFVGLPLLFLDLWLFNRLGNVPTPSLTRLDIYLVLVSLLLLIISYDLLLALFNRQHRLWCEQLSHTLIV